MSMYYSDITTNGQLPLDSNKIVFLFGKRVRKLADVVISLKEIFYCEQETSRKFIWIRKKIDILSGFGKIRRKKI